MPTTENFPCPACCGSSSSSSSSSGCPCNYDEICHISIVDALSPTGFDWMYYSGVCWSQSGYQSPDYYPTSAGIIECHCTCPCLDSSASSSSSSGSTCSAPCYPPETLYANDGTTEYTLTHTAGTDLWTDGTITFDWSQCHCLTSDGGDFIFICCGELNTPGAGCTAMTCSPFFVQFGQGWTVYE